MKMKLLLMPLALLFTIFFYSTNLNAQWNGQLSTLNWNLNCVGCQTPSFRLAVKPGSAVPGNNADSLQNVAAVCFGKTASIRFYGQPTGQLVTINITSPTSTNWLPSGQITSTYTTTIPLTGIPFLPYNPPITGGAIRVYGSYTVAGQTYFSNTITIIQEPRITPPNITASKIDSICPRENVVLSNTMPITQSPNNTNLSYTWSWLNADANSKIQSVSSNFRDAIVQPLIQNSESALRFKVTLQAQNGPSTFMQTTCTDSVSYKLLIKKSPSLNIALGKLARITCINVPFNNPPQITATLTANNVAMNTYSFRWYYITRANPSVKVAVGSATSSSVPLLTPIVNVAGEYKYFVEATTSATNSCGTTSDSTDWYRVIGVRRDTTTASTCSNKLPFKFAGTNITMSNAGVRIDTLRTTNPVCDSLIRRFVLTVRDTSRSSTSLTVCDSVIWNGVKYKNSGVYNKTGLTNSVGCDSTATLFLTVNKSSVKDTIIRICANTVYSFDDTTVLAAGLHQIRYTNVFGCDSLLRLQIIDDLQPSAITTVRTTFCVGDSVGKSGFLTQAGVDTTYATKKNSVGCDSVIRTIRTVNPRHIIFRDTTLCRRQLNFLWNGQMITQFNNYRFATVNSFNCDSIITLRVWRNNKRDTIVRKDTICSTDSLIIGNRVFKNQGVYFYVDSSLACDRIIRLELQVKPSSSSTTSVVICNDCKYTFNGVVYTNEGTYTQKLQNAVGCDSTLTLILKKGLINGPSKVCLNDSACFTNKSRNPLYTYKWDIANSNNSVTVLQDDTSCFGIHFTDLDSLLVILTAYDLKDKKVFSDTLPVVINKLPTPAITTLVRVGCQNFGSNLQINDDSTALPQILNDSVCSKVCARSFATYYAKGSVGSTYKWKITYGNDFISKQAGDSVVVAWTDAGISKLQLEETNAAGCKGYIQICVEKIAVPKAVFNINSTETPYVADPNPYAVISICRGQQIIFNDLSVADSTSPIVKWSWNFGDGITASSTTPITPSHVYNTAGVYIATLTVTNRCNCSSSYSYKVIVTSVTSLFIECKSIVCEGDTATYTVHGLDSSDCQLLQDGWEVKGGTILRDSTRPSSDSSIRILWNNVDSTGMGVVIYNPIAACNNPACMGTVQVQIPVIRNQGVPIVGSSNVCNRTITLYRLPLWSSTIYDWTIVGTPGARLVSTNNPNEIALEVNSIPGGGTITINCTYISNLVDCVGGSSITIAVTPTPEIVIPSNFSGCQNDTARIELSNSPTNKWTWVVTDGENKTVSYAGVINTPLVLTFTKGGWYSVYVTGANMCKVEPTPFYVTPTPLAPDSVMGPDTVCLNQPYFYEVHAPKGNLTYSWVVQGGTIQGSTTGERVQVVFTQASGPLSVQVTSSDYANSNCTGGSLIKAIVKEPVPVVRMVNFNNLACPNSRVTYEVDYRQGDSYAWSVEPSRTGSVESGGNTNQPTIVWNNNAGASEDSGLIVLRFKKCNTLYRREYRVYFRPRVQLNLVSDSAVCGGILTNFILQSTPNISRGDISWNFGDGTITTTVDLFNKSHIFENTSSQPISYIVNAVASNLNVGNCIASSNAIPSVTIVVNPKPQVSISEERLYAGVCDNLTIDTLKSVDIVVAGGLSEITSIQWTKPNGTSYITTAPNLQTHNDFVDGYGKYDATIINTWGCPVFLEFSKDTFMCGSGSVTHPKKT